jgi:hypothetical protein
VFLQKRQGGKQRQTGGNRNRQRGEESLLQRATAEGYCRSDRETDREKRNREIEK